MGALSGTLAQNSAFLDGDFRRVRLAYLVQSLLPGKSVAFRLQELLLVIHVVENSRHSGAYAVEVFPSGKMVDAQAHSDGGNAGGVEDIDSLWDRYDRLDEAGLDDKSAEGQELRTSIKEYIEENGLNIRITHTKSNADLLQAIEDAIADGEGDDEEDDEPKRKSDSRTEKQRVVEPEPEDDDDAEPHEPSDDEEDDQEPEPAPTRRSRERNDDTNEPAARPSRRSARPARRR